MLSAVIMVHLYLRKCIEWDNINWNFLYLAKWQQNIYLSHFNFPLYSKFGTVEINCFCNKMQTWYAFSWKSSKWAMLVEDLFCFVLFGFVLSSNSRPTLDYTYQQLSYQGNVKFKIMLCVLLPAFDDLTFMISSPKILQLRPLLIFLTKDNANTKLSYYFHCESSYIVS